jgi:hypothetical protein
MLTIRSVTVLETCVFVSLFASNKFEDLNEFRLSKMIENIKLQLICIIERLLFCILESLRAEMYRKQPLRTTNLSIFSHNLWIFEKNNLIRG